MPLVSTKNQNYGNRLYSSLPWTPVVVVSERFTRSPRGSGDGICGLPNFHRTPWMAAPDGRPSKYHSCPLVNRLLGE